VLNNNYKTKVHANHAQIINSMIRKNMQ